MARRLIFAGGGVRLAARLFPLRPPLRPLRPLAAQLRQDRAEIALNPYVGAPMPEAGAAVAAAFHRITAIHRWLAFAGRRSQTGAAANDAANPVFPGLILSGAALGLPKSRAWRRLRLQVLFRRGLPNRQARHRNRRHVLGVWALIPLPVIAGTAAVMACPAAEAMLCAAYGGSPPARGGPRAASPAPAPMPSAGAAPASLDAQVAKATEGDEDWTRVAVALQDDRSAPARIDVDRGDGGMGDRDEPAGRRPGLERRPERAAQALEPEMKRRRRQDHAPARPLAKTGSGDGGAGGAHGGARLAAGHGSSPSTHPASRSAGGDCRRLPLPRVSGLARRPPRCEEGRETGAAHDPA